MNAQKEDKSLYDFLVGNKDKIEYVNLIWTWNEMKLVESDKCLVMNENEYPSEIYMAFDVTILDLEYSFTGSYEDALSFADSYSCWDGREEDFKIVDGILECKHEGYNPEYYYHPKDLDPDADDMILQIMTNKRI